MINELKLRTIPPGDTIGLFYNNKGQIDSNPNLLFDSNPIPEELAITGVIQFGTIIPPLSPWKKIKRFLPGYQYQGLDPVGPINLKYPKEIEKYDKNEQCEEIEKVLDKILINKIGNKNNPVVLFSGGVDSGIIACRLLKLGYKDTLLINYSFGETDKESQLAEEMAKQLGLRFIRTSATNNNNICEPLTNPGQLYNQPFGDPSTVPTSHFGREIVNILEGENRVIFDGTGADGGFGLMSSINLFKKIHRIPGLFRMFASLLYSKIYWHENWLETRTRLLRLTNNKPLLASSLANNPLNGIYYDYSLIEENYKLLDNLAESWIGINDIDLKITASDLLITANQSTNKCLSTILTAGHEYYFPFLETEMISLALSSMKKWQINDDKEHLKRNLAKFVPHKMVYREKSGFIDSMETVYFTNEFIDYLWETISPNGPISTLLKPKTIKKACDNLKKRKMFSTQIRNALWAIVFTDRWYRTAI